MYSLSTVLTDKVVVYRKPQHSLEVIALHGRNNKSHASLSKIINTLLRHSFRFSLFINKYL